ncbi:MAG: tol-pal system protein YbgF [Alphaproteobacteria bacterium]
MLWKNKLGLTLIISSIFCVLSQPVWAIEDENSGVDISSVLSRLEAAEADLAVLQRQVYRINLSEEPSDIPSTNNKKEVKPSSSDVPESYSDYLTSRMDLIDQTLTSLTNQVEELQFKNNNIAERLDRIVKDVEFRLNEIENKMALQQSLASMPPAKDVKKEEVSNVPDNKKTPEDLYNQAYEELGKSNYSKAGEYLSLFLDKYSKHELAGNAQYWLGETYYVQGDYEKSAVSFAKCYEKYGKGNKGPDCLLKLGLSMVALGKNQDACIAFKSLNKEYPKALDRIKKRNEAELKRLNCK